MAFIAIAEVSGRMLGVTMIPRVPAANSPSWCAHTSKVTGSAGC